MFVRLMKLMRLHWNFSKKNHNISHPTSYTGGRKPLCTKDFHCVTIFMGTPGLKQGELPSFFSTRRK